MVGLERYSTSIDQLIHMTPISEAALSPFLARQTFAIPYAATMNDHDTKYNNIVGNTVTNNFRIYLGVLNRMKGSSDHLTEMY